MNAFTRIKGLIVATIGAQMIFTGISNFIATFGNKKKHLPDEASASVYKTEFFNSDKLLIQFPVQMKLSG